MGVEYINRISIKKDGVYISTKSSNDSMPYHSVRIAGLSDIYQKEGRFALDKEILRMCSEYCMLRGNHKSLERYRYAFSCKLSKTFEDINEETNKIYDKLSEEDLKSQWGKKEERTPAMRAYFELRNRLKDEMYSEMAQKCREWEKSY